MRNLNHTFFFTILFLSITWNFGCTSPGRSVGAGASAGGVLGAGVGAIADPGGHGENRFRNVVIGTAAGAAVGAGAGYAVDRWVHNEREEAVKDAKTRLRAYPQTPSTGLKRAVKVTPKGGWRHDDSKQKNTCPMAHFG